MCIRPSASSRPLRKPPPSAASPTGTRWSRCSSGRWDCRSRTPRSSRATSTASPTSSANSSRSNFLEAGPVEAKLRQIDFGAFVADWLRDRKRSEDLARFALAPVARGVLGHGDLGPDEFHHPPRHHAIAVDRSRAARRRHAARLRAGGPASGPARRHPARDASDADASRDHGGHPRQNPRRNADAAETLSRRQVCGEPDRRVGDHVLRGSAQRSQASVPRRVRPHAAVLRRPARQRSGLCRSHQRLEARSDWRGPNSASSRAISGPTCEPSSSAARRARRRCCSTIWQECSSKPARRWPATPSCAPRSTRASSPCCEPSSPSRRAASRPSSPIRSRPGTWRQLISLIEINIGKDLQYIRFNGSLIGGLAGLALYTLEYLLRLV